MICLQHICEHGAPGRVTHKLIHGICVVEFATYASVEKRCVEQLHASSRAYQVQSHSCRQHVSR
jgi:hypothetical protein